jgi:hypothetical protein
MANTAVLFAVPAAAAAVTHSLNFAGKAEELKLVVELVMLLRFNPSPLINPKLAIILAGV